MFFIGAAQVVLVVALIALVIYFGRKLMESLEDETDEEWLDKQW